MLNQLYKILIIYLFMQFFKSLHLLYFKKILIYIIRS